MTTPTPSNPLVDLLAGWEDKNGTMAAIMPHEWAELMRPVMHACMYQSPRQIRSDLAARDAELDAMKQRAEAAERERDQYKRRMLEETQERGEWQRKAEEAARDAAALTGLWIDHATAVAIAQHLKPYAPISEANVAEMLADIRMGLADRAAAIAAKGKA